MTYSASQEEISAASAYQDLHVPALFQQWVEAVADAANIQPGDRVLDVACGTGVLAGEIASRVDEHGSVTGLDPDPGMLSVASRRMPAVGWEQGTAEEIPYEDGSFDAVVSQFGLMFFKKRVDALREMVRVLVPGGRIVVAVWDSLEAQSAYSDAVALLQRVAGPRAARALRAPFSLGNRSKLGEMFQEANVTSGRISTVRGTARFPSIRVMMEAELRGWLPIMRVHLAEEQMQRILAEAESDLQSYVTSEGTVEFDLSAHIVSATKP